MTRHMSGPLREKAGWLSLGLFSLRDHVPPSDTPGTSRRAPPLTRFMPSLISWHVAGLFTLASRPCESRIFPHAQGRVISNGAMAEVLMCVCGGGDNLSEGRLEPQLKGLCACVAGILEYVTSMPGQREVYNCNCF